MTHNGDPDAASLDSPLLQHESHCCCGSVACTFFTETQAAFDRLDDSLRTAGRLGQALLVRHETYVAEAETERKQMREELDRVTGDRDALQTQNIQVIEENKQLLLQLETANSTVLESETHVKSLTATLASAQEEVQRLNALARRTQSLEADIERFELDQARLRSSLANKTEDERSALLRWQTAERSLAAMEEHVQAIEKQANAERDNHVEVIARLERRRQIEKDLESAAGRLKGAAAAKSNQENSAVVSHFVKDILQDNANLQLNIVELRELLTNANDQVATLRDQLTDVVSPGSYKSPMLPQISRQPSLEQELKVQDPKRSSTQEVHVHHHYHPPANKPEAARRPSTTFRKPRKRRTGSSFGLPSPNPGHQSRYSTSTTPSLMAAFGSSSGQGPTSSPSVASNNRWSMHSTAAISSVPSSPRSSLFDRPFSDVDGSRPTTPGTDAGDSSFYAPSHSRPIGMGIFEPLNEVLHEDVNLPKKQVELGKENRPPSPEDDDEQDPEHSLVDFSQPVPRLRPSRSGGMRPKSFTEDDLPVDSSGYLRRSDSHESLLSVSGMDIHTLKSRPSQMLTGHNTRSMSSQPEMSSATAQADRPHLRSKSSMTMLAEQNAGLTKRMGGWFGRWGTSSSLQPSPLNPARAAAADGDAAQGQEVRNNTTPNIKLRRPGINQPGAIVGFLADSARSNNNIHNLNSRLTTMTTTLTKVPKEPVMKLFNEAELRQCLEEMA